MEELTNKTSGGLGDKEIVYSKAIKAGKRIYYLDVKKNLKEDLFIAITESKRNQTKEGEVVTFEKHKIFLYKEDFDKFMDGMNEIIRYIKEKNAESSPKEENPDKTQDAVSDESKTMTE
jgi:glycine cleavage system protein P-like pyridoxal-binding family